ncbi:alcohol dehydrogenase [Mycena rosella]|uniref:Alcohol dehydrogenase n=1 Tax=Mycena rosella TaxID=1033263 RepID=A0AAD7G6U9_MYCRO|nr:alcohol dehydrogenase [Mycena rosella]
MAPIQNARVLFNSVPSGESAARGPNVLGSPSRRADYPAAPLNGGFLLKVLVLSVDPYFRGKIRAPEKKSYSPGFIIGAPLEGYGIGVVLRSETPGVEVGKYIYGLTIPHQEYLMLPELSDLEIIEKHPGLPWPAYVGAAGMPGKTAYVGWKEYSDAKPVTIPARTPLSALISGAVGSVVIQLAKQAGMKVIASAGSEEKVQYMKDLGADVAFNYKTTDTRAVLAKEGPINVYWDNVGSEVLEAALDFAAIHGRFSKCGMISGYNTGHQGIKNLKLVYGRSLNIHGILVFRLQAKYDKEFYATIPAKLASGEIKYAEEITRGQNKVGDDILAVRKGENKAKAVIVVAEE